MSTCVSVSSCKSFQSPPLSELIARADCKHSDSVVSSLAVRYSSRTSNTSAIWTVNWCRRTLAEHTISRCSNQRYRWQVSPIQASLRPRNVKARGRGGLAGASVHGVRITRKAAILMKHRRETAGKLEQNHREEEFDGEEFLYEPNDGVGWEMTATVQQQQGRNSAVIQQQRDHKNHQNGMKQTSEPAPEVATSEDVTTDLGRMHDAVSGVREAVEERASEVGDVIQERVSDWSDALQETVNDLGDVIQERVAEAGQAVDQAATGLKDMLADGGTLSDVEGSFRTAFPRGRKAMDNITVLQEDHGPLFLLYDIYLHMLKQPAPLFALAVALVPVLVALLFALLYSLDLQGLVLSDAQLEYISKVVLQSISHPALAIPPPLSDGTGAGGASGSLSLISGQVMSAFEDVYAMTLEEAAGALRQLEGEGLFGGAGGTGMWVFFQLFAFSLAISTGLEAPLSAVSPYALLLANINALFSQLVLVFLSGAVFARLTQPTNPVRCSDVLLITPRILGHPVAATSGTGFATHAPLIIARRPSDVDSAMRDATTGSSSSNRNSNGNSNNSSRNGASNSSSEQSKQQLVVSPSDTNMDGNATSTTPSSSTSRSSSSSRGNSSDVREPVWALPPLPLSAGPGGHCMLVGRYVLSGPQPCELVDVKIELSFRYTTVTPSGSLFRAVENLQLVRAEDSYQRHGMTVRHVIDQSSPLLGKSRDELEAMNAQFCLTVMGVERSSMQSVFHMRDYYVADDEVIWNAVFEEMLHGDGKGGRLVDHSRISNWKIPEL